MAGGPLFLAVIASEDRSQTLQVSVPSRVLLWGRHEKRHGVGDIVAVSVALPGPRTVPNFVPSGRL